jgi:hypothetical protein
MKTAKRERNPKVRVKSMPLTKAEMIRKIQLTEAALFLELKRSEQDYGSEDRLTNVLRSQWSSVNTLMRSLDIESDFQLPDNQAATAIICERIAKQREA